MIENIKTSHKFMKSNLIKKFFFFLLCIVLTVFLLPKSSTFALSLIPDDPQLVADYRVESILFDGDYAYIGGSFKNVGNLFRQNGFVTDTTNGTFDLSWPEIKGGQVRVVVSDGNEGWYIGGNFTSIGDYPINYLAHILADKSVDQNWNPNPDSSVTFISLSGSDIYVGGWFTSIGGQSRTRLAKLNNTTGQADATWNPNPDNSISALAVSGSDIYVSGNFASIGGQAITRIAKLNSTNGNADITWAPNPNNSVTTIAISGSDIYVGGYFTSIGGQTRNRIAKLNNTTGEADLTWNPNANNSVLIIYISGTDIYVGGNFTNIGGLARNRIAKLNNSTGSADATWNPNSNGRISSISIDESDIYVAGYFTSIGGLTRTYYTKLNNTTGAPSASWNPVAYGTAYNPVVSANTSYVFLGGDPFLMENNVSRNYLAKINLTTGLVDPDWNPNPNEGVYTMAVSGDDLYIGGYFTSVGGLTRNRLAKINKNTGVVDATWNPNANNLINTLTLSGSDVYVGGAFSSVGGQLRNRIAKLDNTTGAANVLWNPNANDWVETILVSESDVYVGGYFDTIGGQTRERLAKLNNTTGEAYLNWDASVDNPDPAMWVNDMEINGTDLYVGGYFDSIAGQIRNGAAKINVNTGIVDPFWNPISDTNDCLYSLSILESTVIIGGQFYSIQGEDIYNLAQVDMNMANPDPYFNQSPSMVSIIAIQDRRYWFATEYFSPFLYTYTLESIPPTVSLNTLQNSQLSDNTPTLTGTASDANGSISSVEFQIDSTSGTWSNCMSNDGTFNEQSEIFSCTPITELSEGSHTMYVRAKDSNYNTTPIGSYDSKTFTIDTIFPSLAITYIDQYKVTSTRWMINRKPLFEGIADPNTTIQVQIPTANISTSITSNSNGYWSWKSTTDLPLGTYQVKFSSTDSALNVTQTSVTLVVMNTFNNDVEETIPSEEEVEPIIEEEKEQEPKEEQTQEEGAIQTLQFLNKDGNPLVNAYITIEGTEYFTDSSGEIKVVGLDKNKNYKVKIEYNGVKYESEVLGKMDTVHTTIVNVTDNDIVKTTNWKNILLYAGICILALVIIIFFTKKAKTLHTR